MEYTDAEKQILSLMERVNFKNLSKNDVLIYTSKLNELRPEVARQAIAQFPELADMIKSAMVEYKGILDNVIASDDNSINQIYEIFNKELDEASNSRKEIIKFANMVRSDLSKCLNQPDMTAEEQREIREQEMEVFRTMVEKDSEIREHEKEIAHMADKKDSEKRAFNWRLISGASAVVLIAVGVGAAALGGSINLKLPKKS